MATETEIKLPVRPGVVERVAALGYTVHTPRILEGDQLYDTADGALRQSDRILRLRTRGHRATLTFKGPAQRAPHKSREEVEVDVSDGAAFVGILTHLGYQPSFRYEKYRTTFTATDHPGIITLDETPAGDFLELEGPGGWIDEIALKLGYAPGDYITESYASLWRKHCEANPSAVPSAMVF